MCSTRTTPVPTNAPPRYLTGYHPKGGDTAAVPAFPGGVGANRPLANLPQIDYVIGMMQTQIPNIPNELLQALCNDAYSRFTAETGLTGKVKIDLAFPEAPSPQFSVLVTVIDQASGEQRSYNVVVKAHTVH